jgi:hypothetical protein
MEPEEPMPDITDYFCPDDVYIVAGGLRDEEGDVAPQTFMVVEYTDDDDEKRSITFAFIPWAAMRLGISLAAGGMKSTEDYIATRVELVEQLSQALEAPTEKRVASPYM